MHIILVSSTFNSFELCFEAALFISQIYFSVWNFKIYNWYSYWYLMMDKSYMKNCHGFFNMTGTFWSLSSPTNCSIAWSESAVCTIYIWWACQGSFLDFCSWFFVKGQNCIMIWWARITLSNNLTCADVECMLLTLVRRI